MVTAREFRRRLRPPCRPARGRSRRPGRAGALLDIRRRPFRLAGQRGANRRDQRRDPGLDLGQFRFDRAHRRRVAVASADCSATWRIFGVKRSVSMLATSNRAASASPIRSSSHARSAAQSAGWTSAGLAVLASSALRRPIWAQREASGVSIRRISTSSALPLAAPQADWRPIHGPADRWCRQSEGRAARWPDTRPAAPARFDQLVQASSRSTISTGAAFPAYGVPRRGSVGRLASLLTGCGTGGSSNAGGSKRFRPVLGQRRNGQREANSGRADERLLSSRHWR